MDRQESFNRQLCAKAKGRPFQTGIMCEVILVSTFQSDLSTTVKSQGVRGFIIYFVAKQNRAIDASLH